MNEFRDTAGKSLCEYARPSVTVDTAVLTVDPEYGEFLVALVESPTGEPCLPGTFLHEGETLTDAVNRSLREKVGISGLTPVQLHVFDAPGRDPRGWVISVAHIAVVPRDQLRDVALYPVSEAKKLAYDHDAMLAKAVEKLRSDYSEQPDPWNLLDMFTLKELRTVHEAIDPDTPLRDSFRRMMQPLLVDTGAMSSGSVGKPSRIWRKETEAERIQRKYAKYERPLTRPKSSTTARRESTDVRVKFSRPLDSEQSMRYSYADSLSSSSSDRSARDYKFEIEWQNGDVTTHDSLTLKQALLRLHEFESETKSAWHRLSSNELPDSARVVDLAGEVIERLTF